jgi:dipeptidyl aminopeptidase/acylaminoacyl peptidase
MPSARALLPLAAALTLGALTAPAQTAPTPTPTGRIYTDADYAQAEKFMDYNLDPLVYHTVEQPHWLADGRLWYRDPGPDGVTYMLADPARRTQAPAFDHAKLAAALFRSVHSGGLPGSGVTSLDPNHLPIDDLAFEDSDRTLLITIGRQRLRCDLRGNGVCKAIGPATPNLPNEPSDISPNGKLAAFIRDNNLWVRDLTNGRDTALTTDGVPDFGYATDNAGWTHSSNPILLWSPDSKKIATYQQDQRNVGRMYLVRTTGGHPQLESWRYPLAGDTIVTTIQRVIVDVPTHTVVRFKMSPDQHRTSLCDDLSCTGGHGLDDVQWSDDSTQLAFVSTSRDHKQEWLRVANASTGQVREVLTEKCATFLDSGVSHANWRVLWPSNEVLWYSERDDWGQLYLYDLTTGALKNQITHGDGNVTELLTVDQPTHTVYFLAVGKQPDRDPYYPALYRIHLDGSALQLLTPEDAAHEVTASPDSRYFLDIASTPTTPATAQLRDREGQLVLDLAHQNISRLRALGWVPPQPITVKARDGRTDLYGLLFKPTRFDPAQKYPVVDLVYPGPQTGSCGSRSFTPAHRDMQSLAELGFIVVCIDGTGTPLRSRSFHEAHYADMADNTIPDQDAGIRQLAARYPWIDLTRVGIYGHSGGGAAAAAAMFHDPDLFNVGISESGNHDNRVYEDDWAEKWQGLLVRNPDGTTNYDSQANQNFASNLKGHLLLIHGTLDDNVPPDNTLLVVDALIKANKDFDLLVIPNARHSYGAATPYVIRRRWNYFVRYLAGGTPPVNYTLKPLAGQ